MLRTILALIWAGVAGSAVAAGLSYYGTPLQERPFLPGHALFASSAIVGHGYGVIGTLFIVVGVVAYAGRKRIRILRRVGKLSNWLQIHIFLCTLGPFLVLLHTTFRIGGLVSIAFWSMVLVVASGVFGRYLYGRIPKTLDGRFLGSRALEERRTKTLVALQERFEIDEDSVARLVRRVRPLRPRGPLSALALAVRWDLPGGGLRREVRGIVAGIDVSPEAGRELARLVLEDGRRELQLVLLQPFQRLFRYWHIVHLPLAIVMFLILGVHVAVAVLFGYVWLF